MNVRITIQSPDPEINRQIGYFFGRAREVDDKLNRHPRGLLTRLRDALTPDKPYWTFGGGNEWNHMPGFTFDYLER